LSPALPSLRTARRYLALWGFLALIPLALAGYLTKRIVYVSRSGFDYQKTPMEEIGVFILPNEIDTKPTVNFIYDEGSKESSVEFTADATSGKIILNHVAGPDACVDKLSQNETRYLKISPIHKSEEPFADTYVIAWKFSPGVVSYPERKFPSAHLMLIGCRLKSIVDRLTYTERVIYFHSINGPEGYRTTQGSPLGAPDNPEPAGLFGEPREWTLDLTQNVGVRNLTFGGGTQPSEGRWVYVHVWSEFRPPSAHRYWTSGSEEGWERRNVGYEDLVEVRWESLMSQSHRDIIIVIIGALVALGAAMVLESFRPFIERFVAGHKGSRGSQA